MKLSRTRALNALTASLAALAVSACDKKEASTPAPSSDTTAIKVGILHSLSGTMAISETSLKNTALMAIEEINAAGGVLGRKLVPVVVETSSELPVLPIREAEPLELEMVN